MAHDKGEHQTALDKAHESTGTIRALTEAAQEGAAIHLHSLTTTATTPPPSEG